MFRGVDGTPVDPPGDRPTICLIFLVTSLSGIASILISPMIQQKHKPLVDRFLRIIADASMLTQLVILVSLILAIVCAIILFLYALQVFVLFLVFFLIIRKINLRMVSINGISFLLFFNVMRVFFSFMVFFQFHQKLFHHKNFTKYLTIIKMVSIYGISISLFLFQEHFSSRYLYLFIKLCYYCYVDSFVLRFSFNFIKNSCHTISQKINN